MKRETAVGLLPTDTTMYASKTTRHQSGQAGFNVPLDTFASSFWRQSAQPSSSVQFQTRSSAVA